MLCLGKFPDIYAGFACSPTHAYKKGKNGVGVKLNTIKQITWVLCKL